MTEAQAGTRIDHEAPLQAAPQEGETAEYSEFLVTPMGIPPSATRSPNRYAMIMPSSNHVSGAIAGTASSLAFTIFHGLMISNIWFMLIPMLVAGAMCGFLISWSYQLLVDKPSVAGWLAYNLLYVVLLFLLGPISLLLFEPIMTIPELVSSPNGLPDELFQEVLPLVALYTPLMALTVTRSHSQSWNAYGVVLITCAILVFLLGLNIAPMGLVFLTSGWVIMLLEVVGLIVALNLVYVVAYLLLERSRG